MSFAQKLLRAVKNPRELGRAFMDRTSRFWKNDALYLKLKFYFVMGQRLNLDAPVTFNEKLQWLKLHSRDSRYTSLVDKLEVKRYISDVLGDEYVIPTLGVWDTPDEIDFNGLPNKFVLKTTHDGGSLGVVICKDKSNFDIEAAKEKLGRSLKHDVYQCSREWPYKNVERRIIAEEYLEDPYDNDLHDYKVLCFEGEPKLVEFHSGRNTVEQHQEFYDTNWTLTKITQDGQYRSNNQLYPKPICLDKMLELSSVLSKGFHHLRIDWYVLNKSILKFGEITFFDGGGFEQFDDNLDDIMLGEWINIG